jgi:hypothetical protein
MATAPLSLTLLPEDRAESRNQNPRILARLQHMCTRPQQREEALAILAEVLPERTDGVGELGAETEVGVPSHGAVEYPSALRAALAAQDRLGPHPRARQADFHDLRPVPTCRIVSGLFTDPTSEFENVFGYQLPTTE